MKKRFENMKIGRKLIDAFLLMLVMYVVTVIIAVVNIGNMSEKMEWLYEHPFANVEISLQMKSSIATVQKNMLLLADTENTGNRDADIKKIRELIEEVHSNIDELKSGHVSGKEKVTLFEDQYDKMQIPRDKIISLLELGKNEEALEVYTSDYAPIASEAKETLDEVAELSKKDAKDSLKEAQKLNNKIGIFFCVFAVVILSLSGILWLAITRSILDPVNAVKRAANQIANGQLDLEITYTSKNELGQLADDIRSTAEALSSYVDEIQVGLSALGNGKLNYRPEVEFKGDFVALGKAMEEIAVLLKQSMQQISYSAEQVSGGAEQVAGGAQILAEGASDQAGSIEELAVSMNKITDSVKENAENAYKSSTLADEVGTRLLRSNEQMDTLLENIRQVEKNSTEITGIVKEIEDIAFQTNILALNASVEAARAGDAGRGFSVVAGEVRRLAVKTSGASKLTAELIDRNTEAVYGGMKAADTAAHVLKVSVEGAQEVNRMVDQISKESADQAEQVTEIRRNMEQISEIVQKNSATTEESAAASEELSAQAQILKELVEQFEYE